VILTVRQTYRKVIHTTGAKNLLMSETVKSYNIVKYDKCPGLQDPPPLCTVVPWPVYLRCRPTKSPRASLFLQRLPRPASGSPFHCWQPSIFGCWPSSMELPATRGHVGTISDNLPHSTKDVSVHRVIS